MTAKYNPPGTEAPDYWKWRLYQGFKYFVYILLTINMLGFFYEMLVASTFTFQAGVPVGEIMNVFTAALDSAAWIVLLLLFELETYVIPDEKLKGTLKWSLHAGRALCYVVIVYALSGYINQTTVIHDYEPIEVASVCDFAPHGFSIVDGPNEYTTLDAKNCAQQGDSELFLNPDIYAFSSAKILSDMKRLVWTDVVNASVWIIIVIVLELEVFLSASQLFGTRIYLGYKSSKLLLYGILFVAAIYWWMLGEFLDFWDAFLWLVAFFFIEMNVIQWQEDTHEQMLEEVPID